MRCRTVLVALVAGAACGRAPAVRAPAAPAPIAVLISAHAEWVGVRARFPDAAVTTTPYGEWFTQPGDGGDVIWFHGGYGKVAAAGSTQYAIDRWHPRLLVNLGTCGGFGGGLVRGDLVLVRRTIIYDIVEQMGDADEAIADYATDLDTSRWPARLRDRVHEAPMLSGDRDLIPADLPHLREKFGGVVGDWESGAIAWVAARNHTPLLIVRGVTDVVDATGDDLYGASGTWQERAAATMATLVSLFAEARSDLR